jgi:AcrR family transcriptional regulator
MKHPRTTSIRARRRRDILACAPGIVLKHHGLDTCGQIARYLGLTPAGLRAHVGNEAELTRLLCIAQLDAIFRAVCGVNGRGADPWVTLRAMAAAVLESAGAQAPLHAVMLRYRFMLAGEAAISVQARRTAIENSFQFALYETAPEKPFRAFRAPARLLVGQLLHVPLWWDDGCFGSQADWLAQQVGFIATLAKTIA